MVALVEFVVFYPDNYQGGSGKLIEHQSTFKIDEEKTVAENLDYIKKELQKYTKFLTNGWQDNKCIVKSIKITGIVDGI